ncbi:MAG: 4-phosphoerythronate dehydrogenase [Xanthomonadales bacterium]|nr:4-phosphoerythronate dehydrogenase [Gammaproteobacteria bacterium]NNL94593.1 4-phosphoerythronate dehydrogenase [Xanthomonadales bacterium]
MRNNGLRIVADANIPLLDETFGRHGEIIRVDGRTLKPSQLRNTDVLLVRSVTRVAAWLLQHSPVQFVGTATIGTDHLDISWLEKHSVQWASAPGCNADAAAQYTLAMMMLSCQRLERDIYSQSVGIVGHGNVGSRVRRLLDALGISTVACDPPLCEAGHQGFEDLDAILQRDIISLHVPLTHEAPHATFQMLDKERLAAIADGALLLNTARGDVIDGAALLPELHSGRLFASLDTWPGEPGVDPFLLAATTVASPHVAGYSVEGRNNGTRAIYEDYLSWTKCDMAPPTPRTEDSSRNAFTAEHVAAGQAVTSTVIGVSGVERDDRALRSLGGAANIESGFDALRRDYPLRREFAAWTISAPDADSRSKLKALGFSVAQ